MTNYTVLNYSVNTQYMNGNIVTRRTNAFSVLIMDTYGREQYVFEIK